MNDDSPNDDPPNDDPAPTRRQLLASAGALGVGGAFGVRGVRELFADRSSASARLRSTPRGTKPPGEATTGEATTDGTLALSLDWWVFHRSRRTADHRQASTDAPGPLISLCDVKPGDDGGGCIGVHVAGSPAWVWASGRLCSSSENGQSEPERETEGVDTGGVGELADALRFVVVPLGHCDQCDGRTATEAREFVRTANPEEGGLADEATLSGEPPVAGSLRETLASLGDGRLLDDWARDGTTGDCLHPANTYYVGFRWWLPTTVGNEVQTDSASFALRFYAEQCRASGTPTNPLDG